MRKYKSYPIEIDGSSLASYLEKIAFSSDESDAAMNYEAKIAPILDTISNRKSGQQVLGALPKDKKIVIVPWDESDAKAYGVCNATGGAATAFERGAARIRFSPSTWAADSSCQPKGPSSGSSSDEVLIHELLHAYRCATGKFSRVTLSKPDKQYDDTEEFFAIVITNIYMSEKGRTSLRKDHAGFNLLPAKWIKSEDFLKDKDFFHWIEYFWITEKKLTGSLAGLPGIHFNPFRAYREWEDARAAAFEASFG